MITITPDSVRTFGDLPKKEYIDNGKIEVHIRVANNDFLTLFEEDIDPNDSEYDITDTQRERLSESIKELKKRLTLISILPFVNAMYIDGYAKYAQGDTLTSRFYRPEEVISLIAQNEKKNIALVDNINKIIEGGTASGIAKDKSGISFTVIGGTYGD